MSAANKKEILTVPNLLSLLRLCMIPLFVALYLSGHPRATAAVLALSGLTDLLDGWYARRFNAVTDLGKALDPVADKLTQAAMLFCLTSRYPVMTLPFALLLVKEAFTGVSGLIVIRKTGRVLGAVWHGKVTTLLLYAIMILHLVWKDMPFALSNTLIGITVAMMLLSMALYAVRNVRVIREADQKGEPSHDDEMA